MKIGVTNLADFTLPTFAKILADAILTRKLAIPTLLGSRGVIRSRGV